MQLLALTTPWLLDISDAFIRLRYEQQTNYPQHLSRYEAEHRRTRLSKRKRLPSAQTLLLSNFTSVTCKQASSKEPMHIVSCLARYHCHLYSYRHKYPAVAAVVSDRSAASYMQAQDSERSHSGGQQDRLPHQGSQLRS
ncbi:hypothetical protein EJ06DRAFT_34320 [Trichodelitschia bisporula]|uniref:Uncharacterized protein n=1 Tax=Trichodelitschia bisporula TaxID=703511 RepID=A0A6G1HV31_9PEZI|nr:hypothetical protein EJ06DRAFT_34320 [Trichodelitschia bisporula]